MGYLFSAALCPSYFTHTYTQTHICTPASLSLCFYLLLAITHNTCKTPAFTRSSCTHKHTITVAEYWCYVVFVLCRHWISVRDTKMLNLSKFLPAGVVVYVPMGNHHKLLQDV